MTPGPRADVLVNVIIPAAAAERRPLPDRNIADGLLPEGFCQRWRTDIPAQDVARPGSGEHLCSGFGITNDWALIRWDVTGGFQYV